MYCNVGGNGSSGKSLSFGKGVLGVDNDDDDDEGKGAVSATSMPLTVPSSTHVARHATVRSSPNLTAVF